MLLLIPQRYEFSSKSQLGIDGETFCCSCCWYHKGTNFQANHNGVGEISSLLKLLLIPQRYEFSSKSQRWKRRISSSWSCCWYHKGTNFQANHNLMKLTLFRLTVVADTTKVRIFKQITTRHGEPYKYTLLLLIPQRYEFSSKSQRLFAWCR